MGYMKSLVCIAVFIFVILWPLAPVLARQVTVDDDGPADYTSIGAAVKAAGEGDTVLVKAGHYQETYLPLKDRMVLQGAGADATVIEWQRSDSVPVLPVILEINRVQDVKVDGFTFKGPGTGEYGGIFIAECAPVISNNKIIDGFAAIAFSLSEKSSVTTQEGFPVINGNTITGNKFGIYFSIDVVLRKYDPDFFAMLDLRWNWWGTNTAAEIAQHALPVLSETNLSRYRPPTVLYEPWLTGPVGVFEMRPGNNIYGNRENVVWEVGTAVEVTSWGNVKDMIKRGER